MPIVSYRNAVDCQFFVETDPYNYVTDNRPLGRLLTDILELEAALEPIITEVTDARTGLVSTYPTLDQRLDDIEGSIGASVSVSDMEDLQNFQYIDSLSHAESIRRATPSGFLDFGGIADLSIGDAYDDFAAIRTTVNLGDPYQNELVMWNLFGSNYKPIRAIVNGWIVRLSDEFYSLAGPGGGPYSYPANHVTVHLGSAPVTGKLTHFAFLEVWLEQISKAAPVFYYNGAEGAITGPTGSDPLDPNIIHTVKAMTEGGDWIQLRHRIRLVEDVPVETDNIPYGFNSSVLAQGAEAAPVATYTFTNMSEVTDDAGLWRAGAGDAPSQSDLGTFDGYVYAIPIAMIHRRNSGNYSISNQNGSKRDGVAVSGYLTSGVSGHPANLYYDAIDERDILDLRHRISLTGFNLKSELDRSWQMLIRGELRTNWNQLQYDHDNNGTWTGTGVFGHTITIIDQIANAAEATTNPLRDKQVATEPVALPDGQRTFWSKNPAIQYIKFSFTQGNAGSVLPAGFATYNPSGETLTFNAATLSGAGTGGTKIGSTPPVIMKKSDLTSQPTLVTLGLGTQSSTVKMTGLSPAADYAGYISVVYPGGSGTTFPQSRILALEVYDNGTTLFPDEQFGVTGTPGNEGTGLANGLASPFGVAMDSSGNYIVVDRNNHRVVKINPTTWAKTAQFGVTGIAGADNTHCDSPTGVCIDTSDNIYFCDYGNHRVVKLNSSMVYVTQFGATGVVGTTLDRCNHPIFVDTDSTHLYLSDSTNHRVLKIPVSMASAVDSFGTAGVVGAGKFGLNTPIGIAVVSSGFGTGVWVSDSGNKRVVVLDTSLTFKYQICDQANRNTLVLHFIRDVVIDNAGDFYVTCGVAPTYGGGQGHCVYKYNSNLALIGTFGTPGVPKNNNTGLNDPVGSGLAYDSVNNFIYVTDMGNHRVVKLNTSLGYVGQFGVTGVDTPTISVPQTKLCPGPVDVAVDDSGIIYVSSLAAHVVIRVNPGVDISTRTHIFGSWGVPNVIVSSNSRLKNPLGIAVDSTGGNVWVVDAGFDRIVRLNLNLVYQGYFVPVWAANLPRAVYSTDGYSGLGDIEYSVSEDRFLIGVRERRTGTGSTFEEHTILKYNPASISGIPNYTDRVVLRVPYPAGIWVDDSFVITGSGHDGLVIYDKSTFESASAPVPYETTKNTIATIRFKFISPYGVSSDGTRVLVTEPDINAIQYFDADVGVFRGSAGVPFEAGDDKAHLNRPIHAIVHSDYLVICDTNNHRLLRRHVSAPWVGKDGTISVMYPPIGADKIRIYYDIETYQGNLGSLPIGMKGGKEAIYKSQVKAQSDFIFSTTLGLGLPLTSLYQEFQHLRGMTSRLPLPFGWADYQISPIGMKTGTADFEDDSPFIAQPVTISEGYMGGQGHKLPDSGGNLSSRQFLQQVTRTVNGIATPLIRGFRSIIPTDVATPRKRTVSTQILSPTIRPREPWVITEEFFETLRPGVPIVRSNNLLEAIPHFNYYTFLYQRKGRLMMAVFAEGSFGKEVALGTSKNVATTVDAFYPFGRILVR